MTLNFNTPIEISAVGKAVALAVSAAVGASGAYIALRNDVHNLDHDKADRIDVALLGQKQDLQHEEVMRAIGRLQTSVDALEAKEKK